VFVSTAGFFEIALLTSLVSLIDFKLCRVGLKLQDSEFLSTYN